MKMKKTKRLSVAVIALAMCLLLSVTAWAANADNVTYAATLDDSTLCVSDQAQTVTLTVKASSAVDMDSLTAYVKVPDGWIVTAITNETLQQAESWEWNYHNELAKYAILWYSKSGENVTSDLLATVTITVPAGTAVGEYVIEFEIVDITKDYATTWETGTTVSAMLTVSDHADGDGDGDTDHNCDNCGKENVDEGHHGGTDTCMAGAVCVECNETYTAVDADNHVNKTEHVQQDATCLDVGYTAGTYCEDCDKWISGHEEIPAIGHKNKEHHEKVDATCVATGTIEYWSCPDCEQNFSDEACTTVVTDLTIAINPDNHDLVTTEAKAPTCTEIGWDEYVTCQRDGCDHTTYVEKPATDHAWGEPDYDDNGDGTHTATYTCGNDEAHTKSDAAEEHTYTDGECVCGAVEPVTNINVVSKGVDTYTVNGNVVTVTYSIACKVGYWSETDGKYIAITAVANGDGSYSFTAPEGVTEVLLVVKGDVSGDGNLKNGDKNRLNAYLLEKTTLTAEAMFAADVTGDGNIKNGDKNRLNAYLLEKTTFGW